MRLRSSSVVRFLFFFFKQKTAYDIVSRDWSSDVCSSDLQDLRGYLSRQGIKQPFTATTPYYNTIPADQQPTFPGSQELERRIKSLVRWNALAMVVRANRESEGIGGHISTYASAATLYEVGFNHFFHGKGEHTDGDIVYFQGHAAPG